jgi:hypothetical protein
MNDDIEKAFHVLYGLLLKQKTVESEKCLNALAEAWAIWLKNDN